MNPAPLLLTLALAAAAPVPSPGRDLLPSDVAGHWHVRWSGTPGWARLAPDGSWSCVLMSGGGPGTPYVGTWRVDGGVLLVDERPCYEFSAAEPDDCEAGPTSYAFRPAPSLRGRPWREFRTDSWVTLELVGRVRPVWVGPK